MAICSGFTHFCSMVMFYSLLLVYHIYIYIYIYNIYIIWYIYIYDIIYIYILPDGSCTFLQVFLDLRIHRPQEEPDPSDHKRAGARGHPFLPKIVQMTLLVALEPWNFMRFFLKWLSRYWEWKIIPSDELHHFSEGLVNHQPVIVTIIYYDIW